MSVPTDSTFVIAEGGINHNGQLDLAKELVREAANAGANAIKFQIWDAPEVASDPETIEQFREWEFTRDEWKELKRLADAEEIVFFASVFDESSVDLLVDIGAPLIKVASGDVTHIPLLEHIATKDLPVILSTGISTLGEIETAVSAVRPQSAELSLLQCVSSYPADLSELNLAVMETLSQAFDCPVGFSDHTTGTLAPAVAVAMGATIVEKHVTLDRGMEGPDHELSLEPNELEGMVEDIRAVEAARGSPVKRPLESESEFEQFARRGATARTDIEEGEELTEGNVKVSRPNTGIAPSKLEAVLGRTATEAIEKNEPITWDVC